MWSSCSITFLFPCYSVFFCEFIAPLRRRGMFGLVHARMRIGILSVQLTCWNKCCCVTSLNRVESHPSWLVTTTWCQKRDLLRKYNTLLVIFKANFEHQASAYPRPQSTSIRRNHGGASRITNSPHGLVLIGRTASPQKIQKSLPALLLWPVKGKERGRTDKFFADLVRRRRPRTSLHVDANSQRKEETQYILGKVQKQCGTKK